MWLSTSYFQYYIFMLPALLLVMAAQGLVSARYNRYGKIMTRWHVTGQEVARQILQANGITDVTVQRVSGRMTDHYHPAKKAIFLSDGVFDSSSVAAVGIAAHEAGHAVQHAKGYVPVRVRTALVPVCSLASNLGLPLAIIGVIFNAFALVNVGLILFAAATVFQLITLPVEFNASRRALAFIRGSDCFAPEEYTGAKRMLTAAALTYVAALAQSILQLLYFVMRFTGSRRE